jgi:predicted negative regulator of RcsB-dependent stress response
MATQLDLQEQEQLDALKSFWSRRGNLLTGLLIAALAVFAAWNGWHYWQHDQAAKAAVLFDELDRSVQAADADKAGRVFTDMKERYPRTVATQQAALLTAKAQFDKGQTDAAVTSLQWLSQHGTEAELRVIAQLRLAGLHAQAERYDEALKTLDDAAAAGAVGFEGLVADRRGDVLVMQGKKPEAAAAYQVAYRALGEKVDYRRLVEAKLMALGAALPAPPAAPASGAAS